MVWLGLAVPVEAANLFTTESRYTSSQPVSTGDFGHALDRDGQWLVVGARFETAGTRVQGGAVYVYQRQGNGSFTEYQRLTASDTNLKAFDHFGASVAISGDTIVVGAPEYDGSGNNNGRAYVFEFDNSPSCTVQCWGQLQALTDAAVSVNDAFGWSVDIDGTTIVIGAVNDEVATTDQGAAYIFNYNGTSWIADPASPIGPAAGGADPVVRFGIDVAVSGDLVAVGASGDDQASLEAGAVYVFNRVTGWAQEEKILGQGFLELFGNAVDIDGTTLVAGAPGATVNTQLNAGLVRAYDRPSGPPWTLAATLLPLLADNLTPDSSAGDLFGSAVAIDLGVTKDHIAVGSYLNDDGSNDAGAAYLYQDTGSGWGQLAKLNASDAAGSDLFGVSVAVDSDTAIIGAEDKDVAQTADGAIYSYELTDTDDDGLSDALELKICNYPGAPLCTSINLPDTDGDGTSDFVEIMMSDTDGDGFTNGDEWLIGSDPFDPTDIPADGDVNGDGNVDAADVLLATRMATGLQTPTMEERLRGNVAPLNGGIPTPVDTVIGVDDVLLIQRKALGAVTF
ncbi:MAG: hypothetical protein WBO34_04920 [Gammaproteobacteria bacterium]